MINLKLEIQNYKPIDIRGLTESGIDVPDNIRNSITLYNKALENIMADSEDIAIIELKKAISLNPNFNEAMNLLGLCYSYTKDYARASEMFEKVIEAENNSVKALSYMGQIKSSDNNASTQENETKGQKKDKKTSNSTSKSLIKDLSEVNIISSKDIYKYVIGFVCGALVLFLISTPFYFKSKTVIDTNKTDNTNDEILANYKSDEAKISKLTEENKKIQDEFDKEKAENDYNKNTFKLYEIEKLAASKNYEPAADQLIMIKNYPFKDSEKEKFGSLLGEILPKASRSVYYDGYNLLVERKYQDALAKFQKVQIYGESSDYMERTLYYTLSCYKELDDTRNAVATYQKLKESYPQSQYLQWASNKIDQLTALP